MEIDRRKIIMAMAALPFLDVTAAKAATVPVPPLTRRTLESFADTIVPGAAEAGAMDLMASEYIGVAPLLPGAAAFLNARAPGFPLLPVAAKEAAVKWLIAPYAPDRLLWAGLATLSAFAFDTAAHISTAQAVRDGHPGLKWLGFPRPDRDGLWRFLAKSYGRELAKPHPRTTGKGSPA